MTHRVEVSLEALDLTHTLPIFLFLFFQIQRTHYSTEYIHLKNEQG